MIKQHLHVLGVVLFVSTISFNASSDELSSGFEFDGVIYDTLSEAEEVMRNTLTSPFDPSTFDPTAALLPYQGLYDDDPVKGPYHRYEFVEGQFAVQDPDFEWFSSDSQYSNPSCATCPVFDSFGNDFCALLNESFCAELQPIYDYFGPRFGHPECPESSWLSQGEFTEFPWIQFFPWPAEIQAVGYRHFVSSNYILSYGKPFSNSECVPTDPPRNINIHKWNSVWCPVGYNIMGDGGTCLNFLVGKIYELNATAAKPTENCTTDNPCHPTTGDKTLVEEDFEHTTLPLTRVFHSLTPYPDFAAMGKGWTHTYSQRILDDNLPSIPTKELLDGRGNIESFQCTDEPACTVYRSVNKVGDFLKPLAGGWLYQGVDGIQKVFDDEGKLESIEHLNGNYVFLQITYNADRKVETVVDQSGRSLVFSYNSDGLVESVALPDTEVISYQYFHPEGPSAINTENQRITTVTYPEDDAPGLTVDRVYHYEDANFEYFPTGVTDQNGNRYSTFTYDSRGRVTSSELAGAAGRVELEYTRRDGESFDWSITRVTKPLGEIVTYDMEPGPFRKPESIEDTRGNVTISYDPNTTWRSSFSDREGNVSSYDFTDGLHETSRTEAAGTPDERVVETDWDNFVNRVQERREPGKTTTFTYNSRGQVLTRTVTDTLSLVARTWTYSYFEMPVIAELIGQIEAVDGPRTDVSDLTIYEYYTVDNEFGGNLKGDLKAVVNALGQRTEYLRYDDNGRLLEMRDANNVSTVMTYHPRGWITSRTTDGKTTLFAYDNVGNLTRVTQADGSFVAYEYDDAHRLEAMEDNFGNRIEYTLDAEGNRTEERTYDDIGVLKRQLNRIYNQLNQLTDLVDGNNDATQFGYDSNGNRDSTIDANLSPTTFEYDALDRLTKSIDALQGETSMGYDSRDNLTSVTDPLGNVTQYLYDGLDNLTQLDSPDTGITTYEHDRAGNRTAVTDARGVRVEYDYDALNRLTDISYPDSSLDVSFTYDVGTNGVGRLTGMTDAAGTVTYTYDSRGNLLSETRTMGVDQYVTSYGYDDADRLTQITYPSGMVVDYTLDALGRIIAADKTEDSTTENLVTGVTYEPFGPASNWTYGNGLTMSANFDLDYELDQLSSGSDLDWLFGYDAVGNILAIDDQVLPTHDQTFTYDDLHRLDTAAGGYGSEDFDYEANGNRTFYQGFEVYTYEPQSNRLATQGGWTFARDAVGNRTEKLNGSGHGQLHSFADHNRLTQTSTRDAMGDTVVATYTYDGRGQRLIKDANGETTYFVYGLSGELLGEYVAGSGQSTEYVYINGQPVALSRSADTLEAVDIVVDNLDAGATSTGDWAGSNSVAGHLASDYQHIGAQVPASGGTVVDNNDAGFSMTGTWPSSASVAGFLGSDYQYHIANGAPPGGTMIDDGDAATSQVGTWTTSTSVAGFEGSHYSVHAAGAGANTYTWSLGSVSAGDYLVYAKWTQHANRASNARYEIQHATGSASVTVNQQLNGSQWNLLGTYTIDASSEVVLSDDADGYVIADAMLLVPVGAAPNTATWSPTLSADTYEVYARWTSHANRASNATYTVHHTGGSTGVEVNQRQNGGTWQPLGTFDLDGASSVTLTDQANGIVIADAVYFLPVSAPPNAFTWDPGIVDGGEHEVFARWTSHSNRSAHAVYSVHHAGGTTDVSIDQRSGGGAWVSLGSFMLDSESTIVLTQQDDGFVIADAIRVTGSVNQSQSGTFWIHSDHLGTPRRVSDDMQTTVWRWYSTPFGELLPDDDPDGNGTKVTLNLRFPGQYYDAESGLHYNYFRTYDPGVGRYIESDPIGLNGGVNTFGYALQNPNSYSDFYGLDAFTVHVGINIPFVGGIEVGIVEFTPFNGGRRDLGVFGTLRKNHGGFGLGRFSVGVSQTLGCRSNFDGKDSGVVVGAGKFGVSLGGFEQGDLPNSVAIELGPQLGAEGQLTTTGSFTIGDLARGIAYLIHGDGGAVIGDDICSCE